MHPAASIAEAAPEIRASDAKIEKPNPVHPIRRLQAKGQNGLTP